ncbi:MAG: ATP-dependent DNA helicase [Calditrichaceae bacterium]|nr:ATP-dependent DNA helicase [Calditrichaceae bacterium]MBN2710758.1 ATP-dependent DNA helicase [Calditrichaceae bacterium]RQV95708.1 MAG: ATP-dependent DNA helicase [Calditrichota bacterium]
MPVKTEDDHIYLSVRDLTAHTSSHQMISSFPLPQRGMLGRQAQTDIQKRKDKHYGLFHGEFQVKQSFAFRGKTFIVQGRIDGVYQLPERLEIEEIKSVILSAADFKNFNIADYPQFTEQVLYYSLLLENETNGTEIRPHLIIINLVNDKTLTFKISYNRQHVESMLFNRFNEILDDLKREEQTRQNFREQLKEMSFNLPENRPQQDMFMKQWSECLQNSEHLLASAPTGTGKTAAALYPAIQYALSQGKRLFFITSKTTQQNIVRDTIQPLVDKGLKIKTLFLRASEKMCANDIYFCHEAYCPFAKEYHDRLLSSNILEELSSQFMFLPDTIYNAAVNATLCPFEVLLDLSAYADVIVGDYNYVFDPAVYLRRLFNKKDYSDWILIIDEAHNLYTRGMQYLSPGLRRSSVQDLIKLTKTKKEKIYDKLNDTLSEIDKAFSILQQEGEIHYENLQYFTTSLDIIKWNDLYNSYEAAFINYLIHKVKKKQVIIDDPIEKFFYALRRFVQIARLEDNAFITFYDAAEGGCLQIKCCDPSEYLGQKIDKFHAVIAMSATLDPIGFYKEALGFNSGRTRLLQLESPFPSRNRKIIIVPGISTRFKNRHKHYEKIAEIIKKTVSIKRGNYLAFFPSFEFLANVNLFLGNLAATKIIQKPSMNEAERDRIVGDLKKADEPCLLLAVMGGIFSEGIDYPGSSAIGVFVISPALPPVSYERELLRHYYDRKNGQGLEYAYIYPGMNKVIQSVGRLIRSAQDQGIVVLIGERFSEEKYNAILPEYWFDLQQEIAVTNQYEKEIKKFWKEITKN